jgi:hypothetical protein
MLSNDEFSESGAMKDILYQTTSNFAPIFYSFHLIWIKFSTDVYRNLLCDGRLLKIGAVKGCTFTVQFWSICYKQSAHKCCWATASFMKIGTGKAILFLWSIWNFTHIFYTSYTIWITFSRGYMHKKFVSGFEVCESHTLPTSICQFVSILSTFITWLVWNSV